MPRTAGGKRVRPWRHPLCKRLQQLGRSIKAPGRNNCLPDPAGAPTLQRFWRPFGVGKDSNLARASSSFDDRVRYANEKVPVARAGAQSITRKKGHELRPPAKSTNGAEGSGTTGIDIARAIPAHRKAPARGPLRPGLKSVCAVVPAYSGRKPSRVNRCLDSNSGTPLVA